MSNSPDIPSSEKSSPAEKISLRSSDGHWFSAVQAPPRQANGAGLIVIHEAMGVNRGIVDVAQFYADQGYHVLAPQLYDRLQKDLVLDYDSSLEQRLSTIGSSGFTLPLLDIDTCIYTLKERGCQAVGIVGFCYGGTLSWLAASKLPGIGAAVIYYGSAIPDFPAAKPKCPSIAHWGRQDVLIGRNATAAIAEANPEVTMFEYDAGHAFNAHDRPEVYQAEAAQLARQRSLTFFNDTLIAG